MNVGGLVVLWSTPKVKYMIFSLIGYFIMPGVYAPVFCLKSAGTGSI